jgi:hypothetical protein
MPQLVWLYLTAAFYDRTSGRCMVLADALETVAHARLTRLLHAHWSRQTRLELAVRPRLIWERGSLRLDDTVIPKPFATAMEGLAWAFSRQERKPVSGCSLVLLRWTWSWSK